MTRKPGYRNKIKSVAIIFVLSCLYSPLFADDAADPDAGYSKGASQCMACHKEGRERAAHEVFLTPMGISNAENSPFADGRHDCETCHGPSDTHRKKPRDGERPLPGVTFDHKTPVEKQNEVCLGCHTDGARMHWTGSMHEQEEVACASCHEVHAPQDPVLDKLAQQEKCFACHPRTRSETLRNSAHPLRFGEMTCTDCHNPHDGSNDFLLARATVNDTCYTCHAEKRGPFLWEHAPVTEDCTLCHNPHGSNNAALLTQRPPLLCQQCHSPGGHPSLALTGEDTEDSYQQRFLLARSCLNCHSQVHGSNHPSGVTITR